MGFLDNLTKTISHGVDRARFEADKLQKTLRIQNEIGELRKQIDANRLEFADRALELYKAGQIQSATLGEILRAIEALQARVTLKEEELKAVQAEMFVEPGPTGTSGQPAPGSAPPRPGAPAGAASAATKQCPNCQFQMPATAAFCPNCGTRLGT